MGRIIGLIICPPLVVIANGGKFGQVMVCMIPIANWFIAPGIVSELRRKKREEEELRRYQLMQARSMMERD